MRPDRAAAALTPAELALLPEGIVNQRRQSVKAVCAPIGVAVDFDDSDAQIIVLRAHGRFGLLVAGMRFQTINAPSFDRTDLRQS